MTVESRASVHIAPRDAIAGLLAGVRAPGTFAAQRTAKADDLRLEVKGLGRLRFPISRAQARRLCEVGRPARYGRGEKTLLDTRVRDTCEIPIRAVKIDERRWSRTLHPMLGALGADLGLPSVSRLEAALHGMLVYGPVLPAAPGLREGRRHGRHPRGDAAVALPGRRLRDRAQGREGHLSRLPTTALVRRLLRRLPA
jgi:hypothetical protein